MKLLPSLEIVLPIFNEIETLPKLVQALDQVASHLKERARVSYLFINDGSKDGSRQWLDSLYETRKDVRVIHLIHNFGHGAAIAAGVDHTDADISVFMDADLQDSPEAIGELLSEWEKGSLTVVAARGQRKERNRILFKSFYFLLHRVAKGLPPVNFGTHCLLDRKVVDRLKTMKERNRYFPGLVSYASEKIQAVWVDREERKHGGSRVGFFGLVNLALTAFLSFSSTPVKMVSVLGLLCSLTAIGLGVAIVAIKVFTEKAIPGWASMMTAVAFGSGIQLLCLGIIGEYVARIYDEVKDRPLYLVESVQSRFAEKRDSRLKVLPPTNLEHATT